MHFDVAIARERLGDIAQRKQRRGFGRRYHAAGALVHGKPPSRGPPVYPVRPFRTPFARSRAGVFEDFMPTTTCSPIFRPASTCAETRLVTPIATALCSILPFGFATCTK